MFGDNIIGRYLSGEEFGQGNGDANENGHVCLADESLLVSPIMEDYIGSKERLAGNNRELIKKCNGIDSPAREKLGCESLLETSYCPSLGLGSIAGSSESTADDEQIDTSLDHNMLEVEEEGNNWRIKEKRKETSNFISDQALIDKFRDDLNDSIQSRESIEVKRDTDKTNDSIELSDIGTASSIGSDEDISFQSNNETEYNQEQGKDKLNVSDECIKNESCFAQEIKTSVRHISKSSIEESVHNTNQNGREEIFLSATDYYHATQHLCHESEKRGKIPSKEGSKNDINMCQDEDLVHSQLLVSPHFKKNSEKNVCSSLQPTKAKLCLERKMNKKEPPPESLENTQNDESEEIQLTLSTLKRKSGSSFINKENFSPAFVRIKQPQKDVTLDNINSKRESPCKSQKENEITSSCILSIKTRSALGEISNRLKDMSVSDNDISVEESVSRVRKENEITSPVLQCTKTRNVLGEIYIRSKDCAESEVLEKCKGINVERESPSRAGKENETRGPFMRRSKTINNSNDTHNRMKACEKPEISIRHDDIKARGESPSKGRKENKRTSPFLQRRKTRNKLDQLSNKIKDKSEISIKHDNIRVERETPRRARRENEATSPFLQRMKTRNTMGEMSDRRKDWEESEISVTHNNVEQKSSNVARRENKRTSLFLQNTKTNNLDQTSNRMNGKLEISVTPNDIRVERESPSNTGRENETTSPFLRHMKTRNTMGEIYDRTKECKESKISVQRKGVNINRDINSFEIENTVSSTLSEYTTSETYLRRLSLVESKRSPVNVKKSDPSETRLKHRNSMSFTNVIENLRQAENITSQRASDNDTNQTNSKTENVLPEVFDTTDNVTANLLLRNYKEDLEDSSRNCIHLEQDKESEDIPPLKKELRVAFRSSSPNKMNILFYDKERESISDTNLNKVGKFSESLKDRLKSSLPSYVTEESLSTPGRNKKDKNTNNSPKDLASARKKINATSGALIETLKGAVARRQKLLVSRSRDSHIVNEKVEGISDVQRNCGSKKILAPSSRIMKSVADQSKACSVSAGRMDRIACDALDITKVSKRPNTAPVSPRLGRSRLPTRRVNASISLKQRKFKPKPIKKNVFETPKKLPPGEDPYIPFKARPLPYSTIGSSCAGIPKIEKPPPTIPTSPLLGLKCNGVHNSGRKLSAYSKPLPRIEIKANKPPKKRMPVAKKSALKAKPFQRITAGSDASREKERLLHEKLEFEKAEQRRKSIFHARPIPSSVQKSTRRLFGEDLVDECNESPIFLSKENDSSDPSVPSANVSDSRTENNSRAITQAPKLHSAKRAKSRAHFERRRSTRESLKSAQNKTIRKNQLKKSRDNLESLRRSLK